MSENTDLYDLAARRLTEYMKGKNIRKTPERFEILRIICRTPGIFNIDELQELMEENAKFQVSRVTLFNTLKLFEDDVKNVEQYENLKAVKLRIG